MSTSPTPLRPWMKAEISWTEKSSVVLEWGSPGCTGTEEAPRMSRTARELRTERSMRTLPYVAVMPMSSASGLPSA